MNYITHETHPLSPKGCIVTWASLEDYLSDADIVGNRGFGIPKTKQMRRPAPKVLDYMDKYNTLLNTSEFISSRVRSWDISSGSLDIPQYLSGEPEYFSRISYKKGRDVRIVFSPEVHVTSDSESLYYRGAAILSLIDSLESQGDRVELWLGWDNSVGGKRYESRILAKKTTELLNISSLAAVCCDSAFIRTCEFNMIQHFLPTSGGSVGYNAGITLQGDVTLSGRYSEMHHFDTLDSCKKWIDNIKEKLSTSEGNLQ